MADEVVAMEERLREPAEVAEILSVPLSWVYAAAKDGRLPCVRNGRYVRFRKQDIDTHIAKGGTSAKASD